MRSLGWCVAAALAVASWGPAPVSAQTSVQPYFLIIVDTSGSMTGSTGGGTNSCGQSANRMSDAKCVIQNVVNGYGEINFGLERFANSCSGSCSATCTSGCGCSCSQTCDSTSASGQMLVPITAGNQLDILRWNDYSCATCGTTIGSNPELSAAGNTPLAGSLRAARQYYEGGHPSFPSPIATDPFSGCRPYAVILLTDGGETCGGDPPAAATELRTTMVGGTPYDINTYVIGFGISPGDTAIEAIATAGGTDAPGPTRGFYATDETSLALAFSQIIADNILFETCDGADNDCDTAVDEGFTLYCNRPGGMGPPPTLCVDPGETVCDGLDDNCDGRVDEGLINACGACGPTPAETCDGADNDCDSVIDEGVCGGCTPVTEICDNVDNDCDGLTDESLTRPCGTSTGVCTVGTETCSMGAWGTCTGVGPSPEVCDNQDNDCDGTIDGLSQPCGSSVGRCSPGTQICTGGAFGMCVGGIGPTGEICNGIDDDCDGSTDEGNPGGGATCGTATGECALGTVSCVGGALVCAGGVSPSPETCDARDNDCDGSTDESVPTMGSCGSSTGACSPGALTCVGGSFVCSGGTGPTAETCNGVDDDCDGSTDEGNPGGGATCGSSTGACSPGTLTCLGGALQCAGGVSPGPEVCNGIDDDCNGSVDDGVPTGGACGSSTGECRAGVLTCSGGSFTCVGSTGPTAELCDGRDNDCDASTDEGNPGGGATCGSSIGACSPGTLTCAAGTLTCTGGVGPTTEACNGADDDCDGAIDNGVPPAGPCGSSVGECSEGVNRCVSGAFTCVGARGPQAEVCDARDNDCDASTDEGNPGGGAVCGSSTGQCTTGTTLCSMGTLSCTGATGPMAEACDTLDNDCDGLVDEGNPGGGGVCGATNVGLCEFGALSCVMGSLTCVGETGPSAEICDGFDNDCDGSVDEGNPEGGGACGDDTGECMAGTLACVMGSLVCQGAVGPTPEVCDGLDNDCDGVVDDGIPVGAPCGSSVGECVPGVNVCRGGMIVCDGEVAPESEACDLLDNDCDGSIDEGLALGGPCGSSDGLCMPGMERCVGGRLVCEGEVGPAREGCDCSDNDCDGAVDETPMTGELCPDGASCVDCQCALPCEATEFGFRCPTGRAPRTEGGMCFCVAERCQADACGTETQMRDGEVVCAPDSADVSSCVCRNNECTFSCDGVVCDPGTVCDPRDPAGRCVVNDCTGLGCPAGEICDPATGVCAGDPCEGVSCADGEACRGGTCEASCGGVSCADGERCQAGACVADLCADPSCAAGELCDPASGDCVADMCTGVSCPAGQVCEIASGSCVTDPCNGLRCPSGEVCEAGECTTGVAPGEDAGPPPGFDAGVPSDDEDRVLASGGCSCRVGATPAAPSRAPWLLLGLLIVGVVVRARRRRGLRGGRWAGAAAGALALLLGGGCDVDPFCLTCADEVDAGDAGEMDAATRDAGDRPDSGEADAGDGGPDASMDEVCNELDDDGDGTIDEGFDLMTDVDNCGACGDVCSPLGAFPICDEGQCLIDRCDVGRLDVNMDPSDGCEYRCLIESPDDAVCDRRDNDCDTLVDEDVDTTTDPANCGACGFVCSLAHASASCGMSMCVLDACDPDWHDIDSDPANGCEYNCTAASPPTEVCNLVDDDCDGALDEGNPGGGASCGSATGACVQGTEQCVGGSVVCTGETAPTTELCNGIDDDCDGSTDEGNPEGGRLCGTGTGSCTQGREQCTGGALVCTGEVGPTAEGCDGLDNDCDGTIDEGNPGGGGACGSSVGACMPGTEACRAGAIVCEGATGAVAETCNGVDDDCDGATDEGNPDGGASCGSDVGACAPGSLTCTGGTLVCAGSVGASPETCDTLDNDCDGSIDEGNPDGGASCGSSVGACIAGTDTCVAGAVVCVGSTGPSAESCDTIDNDCDGSVDEGNPGGGASCGSSVGQCTFGARQCVAGALTCVGGTGASPEVCNSLDDDCDGSIDEGNPGGGASCGSTVGACTAGTQQCVGGALSCIGGTGPTAESCNGTDDDCDGSTDEGNPGGGGTCGTDVGTCTFGTRQCSGGTLVCAGGVGPSAEACNALDDDCDSSIDEGNPGGGASCGPTTGACTAGTQTCLGGTLQCSGGTGPTFEGCDGADNDCDGSTDEGWDTTADPNNCGACGFSCPTPANSVRGCAASSCTFTCLPGFIDLDGAPGNGCEYSCTIAGSEICNGQDDDCDGLVDNGLTPPTLFCNANGVCAGTSPTCAGASGWQCNYPATYESTETRCDGLDNDCDGGVDEPFPAVGTSCNNGELGECLILGMNVCNGTQDGVVCNAPASGGGSAETCNALDDDCDGTTDEAAPNDWVPFTAGALGTRYIFAYEASRPDATASAQGTATHRACSAPGRLPWTNVTHAQAEAACEAVGGRLCSEVEWQEACESSTNTCDWSHELMCTSYQPAVCNGDDYDTDPFTPGDQDGSVPSGSRAQCLSSWGGVGSQVFDMSGNVEEWTQARQTGVNPLRGGASNDISGGTRCDFNFVVAGDTISLPTVGFRCCRDTPNHCVDGVLSGDESDVDCGGSCTACQTGDACGGASDCASGVCSGGVCQAPSCADGVQNGGESDVDCGGATSCARCPNGDACSAGTDCVGSSCVLGTCTTCGPDNFRISEVYGGTPDYVEIVNAGSCTLNVNTLDIDFRLDCDGATQSIALPSATVAPGGTYRVVDVTSTLSNEVYFGANICHNVSGNGWAALCQGPCNGSCSNYIDYVEITDGGGPTGTPGCASFTPGPFDMSAASGTESATRAAYAGSGAAGLRSDWSVALSTRTP